MTHGKRASSAASSSTSSSSSLSSSKVADARARMRSSRRSAIPRGSREDVQVEVLPQQLRVIDVQLVHSHKAALDEHVDVADDEVHELAHVQSEDTVQDDRETSHGTVETPVHRPTLGTKDVEQQTAECARARRPKGIMHLDEAHG
ncbi:hypothetical protein THAOC_30451, partial [Thalassiosira oceanica]